MVLTLGLVGCCSDPTLPRDEALTTANQYLDQSQYMAFPERPRVTEEVFDLEAKSWSFTFESAACKIIVIADRCKGADVGGMNAACKRK